MVPIILNECIFLNYETIFRRYIADSHFRLGEIYFTVFPAQCIIFLLCGIDSVFRVWYDSQFPAGTGMGIQNLYDCNGGFIRSLAEQTIQDVSRTGQG